MDKEYWKEKLNLLDYVSPEAMLGFNYIDDIKVRDDLKGVAGRFKKSDNKQWIEMSREYMNNPRVLMHELEHAYYSNNNVAGSGRASPELNQYKNMLKKGSVRLPDRGINAKRVVLNRNYKPVDNPSWSEGKIENLNFVNDKNFFAKAFRNLDQDGRIVTNYNSRTQVPLSRNGRPRVDSDQHFLIYNRPLDETPEYQLPKFRFNNTLKNDKYAPVTDWFTPKDLGSPMLRFAAEKIRNKLRWNQ